MIIYDPKNWFGILLDFPKSPVFRTLAMDVVGAGLWAAFVVWVETDLIRVAVPLDQLAAVIQRDASAILASKP